jgi:hypothetical protein
VSFSQTVELFDLFSEMSVKNDADYGYETDGPGDEIEIEEEIEVTDDGGDDEDDSQSPRGGTPDTATGAVHVETPKSFKGAPQGKKGAQVLPALPGKVTPSKQVKAMKMNTPESASSQSLTALSPDRNPFPTFGAWTPSALAQIEICFPVLTGKNETTNELTRSTKPEARYWKAPVTFKYGNFSSETMRFDNVHIPHHTGKGYGSSYVYLCLPGFVGSAFSEAGKKRAPTKVVENSLVPDDNRWWKIANKVENVFGVINQDTKRFHQKSLETVFDATQSGVSCSVILRFFCKASTTETEALRPITARTVAVEVARGYIGAVDINVQMPVRVNREKAKIEPTASSKDVATDSLMRRLGELGL